MAEHPRGTDNLVTSLKVISKVNQHERLSTTSEVVRIDGTQSWAQTLRRWYNGETRDLNLNTVTRIIDNAFTQLNLYYAKETELTNPEKIYLIGLKHDLGKTIDGLKNLKITYEDDSVIVARIEMLIERITAQLEAFNDS